MKKYVRNFFVISLSVLGLVMFSIMVIKPTNVSANEATFQRVRGVAQQKLGAPYQFGGNGPDSFDCSGFTKYAFKNGAYQSLSRTAKAQFQTTVHVKRANIKKGDLVFFGSSQKNIYHVGIALSKNTMIDAQNNGVVQESIHAPWWHLIAASRPMSSVKYYNKHTSFHVKNGAGHAVYNHVRGSNYKRTKVASHTKYRGKKVTVDKSGHHFVNGKYGKAFYRIYYKGKRIGWIYSSSLTH